MIPVQTFNDTIAGSISAYPLAAQYYQVKDPRLLAQLNSIAMMLSLLSVEQDVAAYEPFKKSRDMTVLADAAIKGILPFGKAQLGTLAVVNNSGTPLVIATGRILLDAQGREWIVTGGTTIAPSASGSVPLAQQSVSIFTNTVATSQPFYPIAIPAAPDGQFIVSINVQQQVSVSVIQEFTYNPEFANVAIYDPTLPYADQLDALVYNIETDETQQVYAKFGAAGIAGYQPNSGDTFNVSVTTCTGNFTINPGTPFTFQYTGAPNEATATMTFTEVTQPGSAPMDIATLREIAFYPSIYNNNAVYLGEFEFLIRRNMPGLRFLSVWNEQIQEAARGSSLDWINTLFVAAEQDGTDQTTLNNEIAALITKADNSYKITNVTIVEVQLPLTINVQVPAIYDFADVQSQIEELVFANYGRDSIWAKKGQNTINKKALGILLEDNIVAIQETISDFDITVGSVGTIYPENYVFVSLGSLTVNVTQAEG